MGEIANRIEAAQATISRLQAAHEQARHSHYPAGLADQIGRDHALRLLYSFSTEKAASVDSQAIVTLAADLSIAKRAVSQLTVDDEAASNVLAQAEALHTHLSEIIAQQQVGAFI